MIECIDLSDDDDKPIDPPKKSSPSANQQTGSKKKCRSPEPGPSRLCNEGKSNTEINTHMSKDCSKNEEAFKMLAKGISDLRPGDSTVLNVVAKLEKTFMKCSQEFKESDDCYDFLSECFSLIQNHPKQLWTHVRQFKEKMTAFCNWKSPKLEEKSEEADQNTDSETSKQNRKYERQLQKLYKSLEECQKRIKELDETEVDWDLEDNSSFFQKRRYEKRAVDIFKKISECEEKLSGTPGEKLVERHPKICTLGCEGLSHKQINAAVDKFINRKFKTAEIYFPNFREIKQIVASINKEENLGMMSEEVTQYAVQCFNIIGKKIKECRERDFKSNVMMATLNEGNFEDPAKADPELEKKLKENKKIAEARVAEVLEHYTKKSFAQEKEEALNSDDEMPAETEDSPDTHESGDDDDYEIISLHEDDETNVETNISSIVSVENGVQEQSVRPQTGKDPTRKASIPAHEMEDQAVPNVTEGTNGVDRLSTFDEDLKEDVEMWSDIEAELTNEGIGSDEERALLDVDDELAAQKSSATQNEDIMCGGPDCPQKKARLEEEKEAAATTAPKMTEIQSLDGSFNPVIVGVESQVSGFSQECEDEPTATAACPTPKATDNPTIDSPGDHQLELPVSAVQHSVTNIIPVRKVQKARKSFFAARPSANIPDDCIILD